MFIRLGLLNSRRQLARNMLVILSMALAALSLTAALSFSRGTMPKAATVYRELIGGDIIAFPLSWTGGQADEMLTGTAQLMPAKLQKTGLSWLEIAYPELYEKGYLAPQGSKVSSFSADIVSELAAFPGITDAYMARQLPAHVTMQHPGGEDHWQVMLKPWDEAYAKPRWFSSGRYFTKEEAAGSVSSVIVNAYAFNAPRSMPIPEVNWNINLRVPGIQQSADGRQVPDYINYTDHELTVIGNLAMPVRVVSWLTNGGIGVDSETSYLHMPILWVPQQTWQEIYETAGGDMRLSESVLLRVENMGLLDVTIKELQKAYPGYTFVSVPNLGRRLEIISPLDHFYRAPRSMWVVEGSTSLAMPLELGRAIGMLMFLVAGMLVSSRMLTGAATRRKEIGVLKALGARRKDIALMTLTESVVVTLIGSSLGFFLMRLLGIIQEIANGFDLRGVLLRTLFEYGLVAGFAVIIATVFALIPAMRMANMTVMEVLRHD